MSPQTHQTMPCDEARALIEPWLDPASDLEDDVAFFVEAHLTACAACCARLEAALEPAADTPAAPLPSRLEAETLWSPAQAPPRPLDSLHYLDEPAFKTLETLVEGLAGLDAEGLAQLSSQGYQAPTPTEIQQLNRHLQSTRVPIRAEARPHPSSRPKPRPEPDPTPEPDSRAWPRSDRYELEEEIGRGAFAVVWRARDKVLDRKVALKIHHRHSPPSERFGFEARLTARMSHPGLVPIHDAGRLPDGRHFYAMQQIGDRTLRDVLIALKRDENATVEAYPLPRLLHIFSRLCLIMAYAHDHGALHRDLKPENILLGSYGEVYIADWGLAHLQSDSPPSPGILVGTPSYMAPELLSGQPSALSTASDVFSLGVVLYELLTLIRPHASTNPVQLYLAHISQTCVDPRAAAPHRDIPAPIAELCLSALSTSATSRPSIRRMAQVIDTVLDGVKEQQRRQALALDALEEAKGQWRRLKALHAQRIEDRRILDERRSALGPASPLEDRRALWRSQQALDGLSQDAESQLAEAILSTHRSLEHCENPKAHALLADLYWLKAEETRQSGDRAANLFFRSLCRQHDTGHYRDRLSDHGELEIRVPISGASLKLFRLVPLGPLLDPIEVTVDTGVNTLPVGSYIAQVSAPGHLSARVPALVQGSKRTRLEIAPPPSFEGDEAFVYIAGGHTQLGSDPLAPRSLPRMEAHIEPFLMARLPVTLAQYCDFLNALAQRDVEEARRRAPRSQDGATLWVRFDEDTATFSVFDEDPDGDRWDPQWPAHMLSWHDANAYCQWLSDRDSATYRLPTEHQWEMAARGVDGRTFPWGNGFDPVLCAMTDSNPGRPLPAPVGTHPLDCSPYGVLDMAGLIMEWTHTSDNDDPTRRILRGGSYGSPAASCRAASRRIHFAEQNATPFGFRIIKTLDPWSNA